MSAGAASNAGLDHEFSHSSASDQFFWRTCNDNFALVLVVGAIFEQFQWTSFVIIHAPDLDSWDLAEQLNYYADYELYSLQNAHRVSLTNPTDKVALADDFSTSSDIIHNNNIYVIVAPAESTMAIMKQLYLVSPVKNLAMIVTSTSLSPAVDYFSDFESYQAFEGALLLQPNAGNIQELQLAQVVHKAASLLMVSCGQVGTYNVNCLPNQDQPPLLLPLPNKQIVWPSGTFQTPFTAKTYYVLVLLDYSVGSGSPATSTWPAIQAALQQAQRNFYFLDIKLLQANDSCNPVLALLRF